MTGEEHDSPIPEVPVLGYVHAEHMAKLARPQSEQRHRIGGPLNCAPTQDVATVSGHRVIGDVVTRGALSVRTRTNEHLEKLQLAAVAEYACCFQLLGRRRALLVARLDKCRVTTGLP
jgi:hypothetical protein